ncbi:4Fe-4S ferredoxin-type, iron-sulphur binding domain containing protein [Rhabdaerophilaceae bacterium]
MAVSLSAPQTALSRDKLVLCSCEKTFVSDEASIARGLEAAGATPTIERCTALCTRERNLIPDLVRSADRLTIACQQEETGLRAFAEEAGFTGALSFVDIRDRAGWSIEGDQASPKMAALLAAGRLPPPALPFLSLESQGVTLIYGRDEVALAVASELAQTLDITVLLARSEPVTPPRIRDFPIASGVIRQAKGHLGAFDLRIDGFALAVPSSRSVLEFGATRNGAESRCDILIDLTGGQPLFSAHELREGYLRCDPRDRVAVEKLIARAVDLVGTFDKPKYITFHSELCAHSRSKITGCTRCLEICPAGAISPAGDIVTIDPGICAGCGSCASVCPTGAASYALPAADDLMKRLRVMLRAYHAAGGSSAHLLFHDAEHGNAIIDALARFCEGLPANVIPVLVNEVTQVGIEQLAAAFAYGASGVSLLIHAKPKHDPLPLAKLTNLAQELLPALGYPRDAVNILATDDPDAMLASLRALPKGVVAAEPAGFLPTGGKRQVMMLALREWRNVAPERPSSVALPDGAPFGAVKVDTSGCTLCLACVSACPTAALSANPERPELRFQEDLCVQCGLCQATCPEKVISLVPQLNFERINAPPVTVKQEEPYPCDNCGKHFGTKSTIDRIKAKLANQHWMYAGTNADRARLIGFCDDCRVEAMTTSGFDPYAGPARPNVRTSEDYFRERNEDKDS